MTNVLEYYIIDLLFLGELAAAMQAAIDGEKLTPRCGGCGSSQGVAPSVHAYRGAFFCIRCCNYLDHSGVIKD